MSCTGLKKYSNVFGKPGGGAHKWRIGAKGIYKLDQPKLTGVAIVDLAGTAMLAALLTFMLKYNKINSFILVFCILMVVALAAHVVFGVPTRLTTMVADVQPCAD